MEQRRPGRRPAVLITERDRRLLAFLACHSRAHAGHVAVLLSVTEQRAARILRRLASGGYVEREQIYAQPPPCYRIRPRGIAVSGIDLPPPGGGVSSYEHDVGLAWLWLLARDGGFGAPREILAERQLRSHDESPARSEPPLAVRLGGVGRGGRERLHYPDLLVVREDGRRVAVELELTSKGRHRLERILAGYGADPRIDAVLYLAANRTIGNAVLAAAGRLGITDLIHVQLVRDEAARSRVSAERALERTRPGRALPDRGLERAL